MRNQRVTLEVNPASEQRRSLRVSFVVWLDTHVAGHIMPLLVGCCVTVHLGCAETAVFADRCGQSRGRWKRVMMFQI
jgi:hypothetical protein